MKAAGSRLQRLEFSRAITQKHEAGQGVHLPNKNFIAKIIAYQQYIRVTITVDIFYNHPMYRRYLCRHGQRGYPELKVTQVFYIDRLHEVRIQSQDAGCVLRCKKLLHRCVPVLAISRETMPEYRNLRYKLYPTMHGL